MPFDAGTTLLLDNAAIHKTAAVRAAAERKGYCLLFTPPYSPELNPIELVFGILKNAFYKLRASPAFGHDISACVATCVARHASGQTVRECFGHVERLADRYIKTY